MCPGTKPSLPELLGRNDWVVQSVLRDETDLDHEVRGWIREAYDVGR